MVVCVHYEFMYSNLFPVGNIRYNELDLYTNGSLLMLVIMQC